MDKLGPLTDREVATAQCLIEAMAGRTSSACHRLGKKSASQVFKFLAGHQVLFDVFEGHAFGFRHQQKGHDDKQQVKTGVEPEGACRANAAQQRQEGGADNHVGDPVDGGGTGNTEVAAF